jgi:hypothetical protein
LDDEGRRFLSIPPPPPPSADDAISSDDDETTSLSVGPPAALAAGDAVIAFCLSEEREYSCCHKTLNFKTETSVLVHF